jgi:hypothetical protein
MPTVRLKAFLELVGSLPGRLSMSRERTFQVDEFIVQHYEVADGVTEQVLIGIGANGVATIQAFGVTTDRNISVTVGVAANNVGGPLDANGAIVWGPTSLTEISITNASGSVANVYVAYAGT